MSYKNKDACIAKALDHEMLFVLMARDKTVPSVVCEWIKQNIDKQPPDKLREALDCAIEMVNTQKEIANKVSIINERKRLQLNFDEI